MKKYFINYFIFPLLLMLSIFMPGSMLANGIIEDIDIIYIDEINRIKQRLLDWKHSWQSGELNDYLAFYRLGYAPPGLSHNQWKNQRKKRVTKDKKISINLLIQDMSIDGDATMAQTQFIQDYFSHNYRDKVIKKISWIKDKGIWLIDKESIIEGKIGLEGKIGG